MSLWTRELAFLDTSPRSPLLLGGAVVLIALAAYGGLYASAREASYWAIAVPALAAFAVPCALTSRDRESGLWSLLAASPLPVRALLWTRWGAGTLVGTAAAGAGGLFLLSFTLLDVSVGSYGARLLVAAPFVSAAASALGLLAGLALGSRNAQAGGAAAALGMLALAAGPRAAAELADRLPKDSWAGTALTAAQGFSPASWGDRFAEAGEVGSLVVLALMAGAFLAACLRVERAQLPSGEYVTLAPASVALVLAALLLPVLAHGLAPDLHATLPSEPPDSEVRVALLGDPWVDADDDIQGPPREVKAGEEIHATLGLFASEPQQRARVTLRTAGGEREPLVEIIPSTFTVEALDPQQGRPAATWPLVLRVDGVPTLDTNRIVLVAEVTTETQHETMKVLGPFVRKSSTFASEATLLGALGSALVLLVACPYAARRRRNQRRGSS